MNTHLTKAKLQEALRIEHAGKHLTVNVPAGSYNIAGCVYLYSDTTLNSDADTEYTFVKVQGGVMFSGYGWHGDVGGYDNIKNVTIDGGNFNAGAQGVELVRFIHGSNITVTNANFYNALGASHLLTFAGVDGAEVTNCTFRDIPLDTTVSAKEALHIDVVHNNKMVPGTDLYDDAFCKNITISGCTFENLARGLGSHSAVAGVFPQNITISGNTFKNTYYDAIRFFDYKDSVISENILDGTGNGIIVHTLLSGAYYTPLAGAVTEPFPTAAENYDYNIQIKDNVITNVAYDTNLASMGYGFAVTGHASYPIGGVQVTGNQIGAEDAAGNLTSASNQYGIYLSTKAVYNTIYNNFIAATGEEAIMIKEGSSNNTLVGNEIHYPGTFGIYVSNSDGATLTTNRVVESGRSSYMFKGSSNASILENRSKSSGGGGVVLTSSSHAPTIQKNIIYNPSGNAVYTKTCNTVKVINNTIQRVTKGSGVYIADCVALNTSYNKFTSTTMRPIYLTNVTKANTTSFELMTIDTIKNGSTRITGTAGKAGSTITMTIGSNTYTTTASSTRAFTSPTLPKLTSGTTVKVVEEDVKHNTQTRNKTVS